MCEICNTHPRQNIFIWLLIGMRYEIEHAKHKNKIKTQKMISVKKNTISVTNGVNATMTEKCYKQYKVPRLKPV